VVDRVTPAETLSVVAGVVGDDTPPMPGPATSTGLQDVAGVAVDRFGNLYLADSDSDDVDEVFGVASATFDPTSTAVSCSPSSATVGKASTCTATVTDTAASGALAPTGTVSFTSSPAAAAVAPAGGCTLAAAAAGVSTCQVSFTPSAAGTYAVTATYGGDTVHHATSGQATVTASALPSPGRATLGHARVSGTTVSVPVTCRGGSSCKLSVTLSVRETLKMGKITAVAAKAKRKRKTSKTKTVVLGSATVTIPAGATATIKVKLNAAGKRLLVKHRLLRVKLAVMQSGKVIGSATITFKEKKAKRK